eukprot:gene11305-15166_t
MWNITCQTITEVQSTGNILLFLLKNNRNSIVPVDQQQNIISAQVFGFINIDKRWLKSSVTMSFSFDYSSVHSSVIEKAMRSNYDPFLPQNQHWQSVCHFLSSRVAVSETSLNESGVFLEFEVDHNLLHTYKGLFGSINYFIELEIQENSKTTTFIRFPFALAGPGSNLDKYSVTYCNLISYPVSSLPTDNYFMLNHIGFYNGEDESNSDQNFSTNIYKIRDKQFICCLQLIRSSIHSGQDFEIFVDFTDSLQSCRAIRAAVYQCEKRIDGSRIQEKQVCSVVRSTVDMETMILALHIPLSYPCTFECPFFMVDYRLDMDFCLSDEEDLIQIQGTFEDPLSFSLPITIIPPISLCKNNKNDSTSFSTTQSNILQMAHLCIESSFLCDDYR